MRKRTRLLSQVTIILIIMFASSPVWSGDISKGKTKSALCEGCHGANGISVSSIIPNLAGQKEEYISLSLKAFKTGSRINGIMSSIATQISDDDINDISAYYASQKISENQLPILESDDDDEDEDNSEKQAADKSAELDGLMAAGSDLYRNGDLKTEVSACIACHGPFGEGNKPASFPALKGQHADYLIKALTDFKNGARSNVSDNMMHMIAKKMTVKEIEAVSYHISMMK